MPVHLEATTTFISSNKDIAPTSYLLGPDDQITLFVDDLEEISNKPMRIDMRGELNIPLVGRIHATGLTAAQCEAEIERC